MIFELNKVAHGHALELAYQLLDNSINLIITSPPYFGLRSYNTPPVHWPAVSYAPMAGLPPVQIPEMVCSLGLEADLWAYVGHLVLLFRELKRALHPAGSLWINLGDSYASSGKADPVSDKSGLNHGRGAKEGQKSAHAFGRAPSGELSQKNLLGIPHRVAFALQADGWWLRSDVPWLKRNGMPGSQQDRPTTSKEYWFLLSKSEHYYYDQESVKMPVAESSKGRLSQDIVNQVGTTRANGGAKTNGNLKAVGDPESGRYRRDSDWFFDSLRAILESGKRKLKKGERGPGQILLTDEAGDPLALTVNPKPYNKAHFAVFPPELVAPLVLASSSEYGHCPECGNPWQRVIEKKAAEATRPRPFAHNGNGDRRDTGRVYEETESITTGWQPTCAHGDLSPIPALILDPFSGSGTVMRVARENRRNCIGFELNEDYLDLTPERATVQIKLFN